ncbi:CoA transferase [Gilvimarinus agarilyticus]|uniref:CaiB/BaiF CoA transferase family protein n=1 Tax=Gilvimarinus sp. 2_MG-2023 TaxID=3062666 RepID=UPI001C0884EC|nr:CoA transferase [Gilvimarinus sp. 2_MG-2023]MBU2887730.1 CoA transferase [Gilvimarinus agarilyticus]MDO6572377.1 CoA transferase [Gilvimarinus sp. 2_MG-2023]
MSLPLAGLTVLEFSQYLAGPYAGLRLADLGARVIKIERPGKGDACRQLATKNLWADGDSVLFHTINRNKESFAANLKDPADVATVKKLIAQADVITHNFRPGIMQRLGLDYESVKAVNPELIYGEVSGYGDTGPWKDKPGQDLLAQSVSGLAWVTGNGDQPPTPFGIAVADMLCGTHLAQGLLAALVRKKRFGVGAKVNVSLLESILDFQFEGLTAYLNSDNELPERSQIANGHPYVGAPYGIYATANGHIAISMGDLKTLCDAIGLSGLEDFYGVDGQFFERDNIKATLQKHLKNRTSGEWLQMLEQGRYWCSEVLDYEALTQHEAYQLLGMEQTLQRNGASLTTTRCPIRYNGERIYSDKAAPKVGADNERIQQEFAL